MAAILHRDGNGSFQNALNRLRRSGDERGGLLQAVTIENTRVENEGFRITHSSLPPAVK